MLWSAIAGGFFNKCFHRVEPILEGTASLKYRFKPGAGFGLDW